jgi:hypothetical protein
MPLVTGPSSAIQPVQLPDMVGDYAKLAMLKNQLQEAPLRQQALQQQVDAGAIENQRGQQNINSQKAMMRAYSEAGGDLSKTVPLAAKYGASPDALVKLQQSAIEQQSANIKLLQEKGSRALQEADLYQGAHDAVAQAPAAQRPAAYQQQVQGLQQAGIDVSQLPPQYPGDEAFKTFGIALKGHKQQLEDLAQQANMGKTVAQTSESNAKANEANVNASLAPQKVANQVANDATMRKQGAQRISIEQARLAFDQKKSGIGADGQPDPNAQAIASGHIVPERMSYLLARNPGIVDSVMKLDPSFDSSKAQAYPATYKDFTSGKTSIALNAGGTALAHLKELSEMNTNASHIPGTPEYNAYQNKADTVSSELAKFYGDATIPAIASIKKTLTATLPGNRQAAIQTQAQSMGDKLDSFQKTWENAAPSKAYQAPMPGISQKAINARSALDPRYKASQTSAAPSGGSGLTVTAPNGKTYSFKDQASADAFKQKAGIQ